MKRIAIIVTIIALLVVAYVLVAFFGTEKENIRTEQTEDVSVEGVGTPTDRKTFSGVGSLTELKTQGKNLECQVVYEKSADERIEGTYFVSKGNVRGDFVVPAPEFGGTIVSSMIVGGDSLYVWSKINDDMFGFKSSLSKKDPDVDSNEPVPLDASVRYTCAEWTEVDGSVFVPPADVEFKDLDAVIEAGMEYGNVEEGF